LQTDQLGKRAALSQRSEQQDLESDGRMPLEPVAENLQLQFRQEKSNPPRSRFSAQPLPLLGTVGVADTSNGVFQHGSEVPSTKKPLSLFPIPVTQSESLHASPGPVYVQNMGVAVGAPTLQPSALSCTPIQKEPTGGYWLLLPIDQNAKRNSSLVHQTRH
jgi:hypothetical protein